MSKRGSHRWLGLVAVVVIAAAMGVFMWRRGHGVADTQVAARDSARKVTRIGARGSVVAAAKELKGAASWLVEPGVPARRIAGVVLDRDRPVAGAEVRLRSELDYTSGVAPPVVISDAAGRFDFGARVPTLYEVSATMGPTIRATVQIELRNPMRQPAPDDLTLRLEACEATVRGRVRDVDAQPIATAVISTMTTLTEVTPSIDISVEADGTFAVCAGRLLTVHAPGYGGVMLLRQAPASGWDVVLFDEAVIEGTVVTAGQPTEGARVALMAAMGSRPRPPYGLSAFSDAAGRFRIAGVPPADYQVLSIAGHGFVFDRVPIRARAGETTSGVRIELEACRSIAGVVLDGGRPVAGVHVVTGGGAWTQLDGTFVVPCVPSDADEIDVNGYDVERPAIPAGTDDIDDLVVRVTGRSSIAGRVLTGGQPVAGAHIEAAGLHSPERGGGFAVTDRDGRFVLFGLPADSYQITATDPRGGRRSRPVTSMLERGHDVDGVELTLDIAGAIEGVVVDRDGDALSGVTVALDGGSVPSPPGRAYRNPSTRSGADGRFTIGSLAAGTYQVYVAFDGGVTCTPAGGGKWPPVTIGRDDERVTLRLVIGVRIGLTVSGRVVDDRGAGVAYAAVRAAISYQTTDETTADAEGRFVIGRLVEGPVTLSASDREGAAGQRDQIEAGAVDVDIVLVRPGSMVVTLRGGDDDCVVEAYGQRGSGGMGLGRGRVVTLDSLPPRTYQVLARCRRRMAQATVELAAGQRTEVDLSIGDAATIRARTIGTDGAPIAGIECRAVQPRDRGDVEPTPSGADGIVMVVGVAPGEVEISCAGETSGRLVGRATTTVAAGATAAVDVVLRPTPPSP